MNVSLQDNVEIMRTDTVSLTSAQLKSLLLIGLYLA